MKTQLMKDNPDQPYEAWLVIDEDNRKPSELAPLWDWQNEEDFYGLAVSTPCFELWLLLHFEDRKGASSKRVCTTRLRNHLPNYDKNIDSRKFNRQNVKKAIESAKQRDATRRTRWPETTGTTVYQLVEKFCENAS